MMTIYNKEIIAAKLHRWDNYIAGFHLPTWEELPDFELYMDQVITFITHCECPVCLRVISAEIIYISAPA